jgi:hypothetical protein
VFTYLLYLLTRTQKVTVLSQDGSMLAVAGSHDVRKSSFCLSLDIEAVALVFSAVISVIGPNFRVHPFGERNLCCYIFRHNGEFSVHYPCSSFINAF